MYCEVRAGRLDGYETIPATVESFTRANDRVAHHHLATWHAAIPAAETRHDLLLSEDMQPGRRAADRSAAMAAAL